MEDKWMSDGKRGNCGDKLQWKWKKKEKYKNSKMLDKYTPIKAQ